MKLTCFLFVLIVLFFLALMGWGCAWLRLDLVDGNGRHEDEVARLVRETGAQTGDSVVAP